MSFVQATILLLIVVLLVGCIEIYEFDPGEINDRVLVVDGRFTSGGGPQTVRLSFTVPQNKIETELVRNATVLLFDEEGNSETYFQQDAGVYVMPGNLISGEVGKSYFLHIELEDGRAYRSRPAVIPPRVQATAVTLGFDQLKALNSIGNVITFPTVEVGIRTPLPDHGKPIYLRWFVEEVYSFPEISCGPLSMPRTCYVNLPSIAQRIPLFTNENSSLMQLDSFNIGRKTMQLPSNEEFRGLHYFTVHQFSITPEAFRYWSQLENITNQQGNIFDATPASVPGNVYNINDGQEIVLGYFEVSSADTVRNALRPSQVDEQLFLQPFCPEPGLPFNGMRPLECCNCGRIENSTYQRPPWF